jgi:uracil-DNA glycosylase
VVFIAFGSIAEQALAEAAIAPSACIAVIQRDHPAAGDAVLALPNPLTLCNEHLIRMNARPISWGRAES